MGNSISPGNIIVSLRIIQITVSRARVINKLISQQLMSWTPTSDMASFINSNLLSCLGFSRCQKIEVGATAITAFIKVIRHFFPCSLDVEEQRSEGHDLFLPDRCQGWNLTSLMSTGTFRGVRKFYLAKNVCVPSLSSSFMVT